MCTFWHPNLRHSLRVDQWGSDFLPGCSAHQNSPASNEVVLLFYAWVFWRGGLSWEAEPLSNSRCNTSETLREMTGWYLCINVKEGPSTENGFLSHEGQRGVHVFESFFEDIQGRHLGLSQVLETVWGVDHWREAVQRSIPDHFSSAHMRKIGFPIYIYIYIYIYIFYFFIYFL